MIFQLYQDAAREWRWRLRAKNHRIIATSGEGYQKKTDCIDAIARLKYGVSTATVHEVRE